MSQSLTQPDRSTDIGARPQGDVFNALFSPGTIALVGASNDPRKNTSRPQRMLTANGFSGTILPINPNRDSVLGLPAYPSILDAPVDIDHAFVMVPATDVLRTIEQCAARGVTLATIYTDGFAETGHEGRALQDRIVAAARAGGLRLLGPNCSGIYSTSPTCALSVNAALEQLDVTPGPLAIISQSGSMTGGLVSRGLGRGVGFSRIVSIGNEADLGVAELVEMLADDPATGSILLFIESIRDAPRLGRAARRALGYGKPVVAYKLGRSEIGRDLAASHTGAMVGSDESVGAFFRGNGILRVNNLEALFELPTLLKRQQPVERHRVAVMSTTGGGAGIVVDRLGTHGVDVVPPSTEVVERLAARNISISTARVTDLTHAGTRADVYGPVLEELLASDHCDLVLAVAGSSAQFQPEIAVGPVVSADSHGKPLAMFIAPHAPESLKMLADHGVSGFRTPESCVDAISAWTNWASPPGLATVDPTLAESVERILAAVPAAGPNESWSTGLFAALGIEVAASEVIETADQPVQVSFPVACKVLSPDIAHKSDVGGVVIGVANDAQLATEAAVMIDRVRAACPSARIEGVLVQEMASGVAEAVLGFRRDAQVGPLVVLGVGGVLAEVYRDFSVRLAPVGMAEASQMIDEVRGLATLAGFRGAPAGDRAALAHAIVAMSQLAEVDNGSVTEAEINPLIVRQQGDGVVAVDGLVVLQGA